LITEYCGNRVIEVDHSGNIVWQISVYEPYDAERLINGNTLIAQYRNYNVIEVDNSGNIIWQPPGLSRFNFDVERLVPSNQPPVADAGGPYVTDEGSEITFDASGSSDPDEDELEYRWDLDNDGNWDTDWSTNPTAAHTWNDDYSGDVVVEVSDGEETDTATASVTVNNVAPTVNIDSVVQPTEDFILPNDVLTFTGSFSDPGTEDTHTIEWDFGDLNGITETLTPTHQYAEPGEYTVTLTVTDDNSDQGTASTIVTVISAQEAVGVMDDYIIALPDEAYWKNPDQRGNTLSNKLDEITIMIDAGEYQDAIDKLQNDLRPKMDGNPSPEDWIIDSTVQVVLCRMIDALTGYLTSQI